MISKLVSPLVAIALFMCATPSSATQLFTGDFSLDFATGPLTNLTGNFEATFDESLVMGGAAETFDVALSSFSLAPNPLGSTTFDTTNVGMTLLYFGGVLQFVDVGGLLNTASVIDNGTDDFRVQFFVDTLVEGGYSLASSPNMIFTDASTIDGTLSVTSVTPVVPAVPVPAPATLALLGLGLIGVGTRESAGNKLTHKLDTKPRFCGVSFV